MTKWTEADRSHFRLHDARASMVGVELPLKLAAALNSTDLELCKAVEELYDTFPHAVRKAFCYGFIHKAKSRWVASQARRIFGGPDANETSTKGSVPIVRAEDDPSTHTRNKT